MLHILLSTHFSVGLASFFHRWKNPQKKSERKKLGTEKMENAGKKLNTLKKNGPNLLKVDRIEKVIYSGFGLSRSCKMSVIYFYLWQLLVIPTFEK